MALANFFDKSALAASQILQGYDRTEFENRLLTSAIEVTFDGNAVKSGEGIATLELTIRILARLYPKIVFTELEPDTADYKHRLIALAQAINPEIELEAEAFVATIAVGNTPITRTTPVFYIGSDGWNVRFSPVAPVGSADSLNPFAAGAAACFGAANVFRHVFADQLQNAQLDTAFNLSLVDFEKKNDSGETSSNDIGDAALALPETILVGLGAVGNGAVWALSKIPLLEGTVHLIDPEKIDLSNLQRYIMALQNDKDRCKTELAADYLKETTLNIVPHFGDWSSFLADRNNWHMDTVLIAVDNAPDRINIQGSLPKYILNAWTQPTDLGISRHFDFLKDACLACLYPPKSGSKSESVLIAESFGLLQEEVTIREMLYNNAAIDEIWLAKIAAGKSVPIDLLTPYVGRPIREFYHAVFCGGVLIGHESNSQVETPMAFQSALAGILLASELIIKSADIRTEPMVSMTRINLLKPLSDYLNEAVLKPQDRTCICCDDDFKDQYYRKYAGDI
ncbi:E2 ligase fold family C protein [Mucilaginibacter sabulilitoris]|uniref:E2 ligase fold family C protein n=1 Tax=Mucilaginibacter sabulilitoris TaxID=1173583 RepID=A0ABZ0TNU7_9SPHI|nr:E2 ligase fold family C protein [Mucilaginibacter sabulilitoris]WPU94753.1 E2 ligase fold family C protein [Mucilaginibacter sabulilitoris]